VREAPSFHAEEHEPLRETVEHSRKFDGITWTGSVRRYGSHGTQPDLLVELDAVEPPWLPVPTADCVDHHRDVGVLPRVDQPRRFTVTLDHVHPIWNQRSNPPGHLDPESVIASVGVTDTYHNDPRSRTIDLRHIFSTSRSRKCVAHEIHGS